MFHTGDCMAGFTAKLIEDWDVIFDEVEQGRLPDYSMAEGWIMDSQAFHELMPCAWWKDKPGMEEIAFPTPTVSAGDDTTRQSTRPSALLGFTDTMSAWKLYCTYLRSRLPPLGYSEDYANALGPCVEELASYRDGAAVMMDHTAQDVIPELERAVNTISDICLYPLYRDWYRIGNRAATLARRGQQSTT
ncbi:hypothetical protein CC1G_12862 [Coprinopsis cinerea okayama7|uniref:Uncharacterized protein n=1 Tax=Coprinopsis cinerea (strain Okayama-7 / 130 / ATCC MYA-4618 / FGSC 9003) TaxID=240176 RepID=A8PAT6_COPC7|nr:hypothetical protein CC1G_12862 [Coprinopsis cinerea okayama7\|eukprot:XP_001840048.2 hypothetical protein CC1G_12862 [Coprinopsis cinerea okayama7\